MKESFGQEKAKWNKILATEGMPEEIDPISEAVPHTPAFDTAVSELYEYYVTTNRHEWGAHRERLGEIRERMKAGGAKEDELELLSEDFARDAEDTIAEIQRVAQERAQEVIAKRPSLASRPDAIAKQVAFSLKEIAPALINKDVLRIVAEQAATAVASS